MGCGPVDVARLSILYLPRYYCAVANNWYKAS